MLSSRATTSEILEVGKSVDQLNDQYPIENDVYLDALKKDIKAMLSQLISKSNQGIVRTELDEKDLKRDIDVRAIFYEVNAKCNRRESETQKKALEVLEVLSRYGLEIIQESYSSESAKIRALLDDLKAPDLSEAVKAIPDLPQLITNLEESQAAFDAANIEYINDKSERENTLPAHIIADELHKKIDKEYFIYVKAMSVANADSFSDLNKKVETLLSQTNQKIKERLAALKRKKEQEEDVVNLT
ncbi:MAG: DUF6261 family protein [Bacteroidales bacterium]|nr:DUF6261 family protein [Bacteroidales bacterium]